MCERLELEKRIEKFENWCNGAVVRTLELMSLKIEKFQREISELKNQVNKQQNYFELKYGKLHTLIKDVVDIIDKSDAIRRIRKELGE